MGPVMIGLWHDSRLRGATGTSYTFEGEGWPGIISDQPNLQTKIEHYTILFYGALCAAEPRGPTENFGSRKLMSALS